MDENKSKVNEFEFDLPTPINISSSVSLDFAGTADFSSTPRIIQTTEVDKSERNPNAVHVKKYRIYLRKYSYGEKEEKDS